MTDRIDNPIILCPGQGAQAVGMGKAWAELSDAARTTFAEADETLGLGLTALCFDGPAEQLNRTDITQAAIYTVSVACHRALAERGLLGEPVACAGLSLGEFTALHLAGAFDFATGLRLVRLRGEAMQEAAEASPSTMLALTGEVEEQKIVELCDEARGEGVLVPANFNSPMQVVISGSIDACARAAAVAEKMGFKPTPLSVAGAFHSPIMRPAAERLAAALAAATWRQPTVPVLANVTAESHEMEVERLRQRLVEQLTSPVRWSGSMQWAVANLRGTYVELAPGKVLTGLMRRIDRHTRVTNFAEPARDMIGA